MAQVEFSISLGSEGRKYGVEKYERLASQIEFQTVA